MSNKDFVYICPNCKKTLNYVGEAQNQIALYHYYFEENIWEHEDSEYEEHINYYCPDCGKDFPKEFQTIIDNAINKESTRKGSE